MPLRGDFAALSEMKRQLEDMSKATPKIAATATPKIEGLIDRQFGASTDPYGNPWAPTKDGRSPLQDMRGKVSVSVSGKSVSATVNDPVAEYHQTGTGRMPQRMLVPTEGMGIPPMWKQALEDASSEVMTKAGAEKK